MKRAMICSLAMLLAAPALAGPEDVKFPRGWRDTFVRYWAGDRAPANDTQTGVAWANRVAVESAKGGGPLAHGSVIVFEVWKAKLGGDGKPLLDARGQRIPDTMAAVAVMEKQPGFGSGWPPDIRNGEWEMAAFRPDGTFISRDYAPCLACHKPLAAQDHIFTRKALDAAAGR